MKFHLPIRSLKHFIQSQFINWMIHAYKCERVSGHDRSFLTSSHNKCWRQKLSAIISLLSEDCSLEANIYGLLIRSNFDGCFISQRFHLIFEFEGQAMLIILASALDHISEGHSWENVLLFRLLDKINERKACGVSLRAKCKCWNSYWKISIPLRYLFVSASHSALPTSCTRLYQEFF